MSCYYQNAGGIRTRLDEFKRNVELCNHDVIFLTETWLNDSFSTSEVKLENFEVYRTDRDSLASGRSRGGGVMIAVHKSLKSRLVFNDLAPSSCDLLFVSVQLETESLLLGCTYIPPSSSVDLYTSYCDAVERVCSDFADKVYLVGDYNLNSATWSEDDEGAMIVSCPLSSPAVIVCESFNSLSLHQLNSLPNDHGVFLDLLFSNDSELSTHVAFDHLLPNNFHHNAFSFEISLAQSVHFYQIDKLIFDYAKCNIGVFKEFLSKVDWKSTLGHQNLDYAVESFYNVLRTGIELSTPQKRVFSSTFPRWFSGELKQLTLEKKRAHAAFKRSRLSSDYARFSELRAKCKFLSNECKKRHLDKVSVSISSNPRFFWRYSEETRKVDGLPKQMFHNGVTCSTPQETADLLAQSFSSVYQGPHRHLPNYDESDLIDFNHCQFTQQEVLKALSSLSPKYSSGPDNVPSFVLRKCAVLLSDPLCVLFNRSLSSHVFPACWKLSYLLPIFKSGNRCDVSNYRGVCIQSAIPKVLDKLITTRLTFACKHFIADQQHGFTSKRSTVTNLLCYQHDIIQSFQTRSAVHSVYTDVAKAFDRVDTDFLLLKLKSYGIGESFLTWLSSYFSGRTQTVRVGDSLSQPIQVTSGVGQGSHIGPLLFSLFFNDLPRVIQHSSVLLFADDVKLYRTINSITDCHLLQNDISFFHQWLSRNGLSLSLHKCFVVEFSRSKSLDFTYNIDGVPLVCVEEIKDLGIILDRKLSFVSHTTSLSMRCHRILGYIWRNSKGLSSNAFILLYKALVRSILEYCCVVWSPHYGVHVKILERVQRKFMWYLHFRYPNVDLELPSLMDRRITADNAFLRKLIAGDIDCSRLLGLIKLDCHRRLRNNRTYLIDQCSTNYSFHLPLNRMMRAANF